LSLPLEHRSKDMYDEMSITSMELKSR
jgi:hypothetical protein